MNFWISRLHFHTNAICWFSLTLNIEQNNFANTFSPAPRMSLYKYSLRSIDHFQTMAYFEGRSNYNASMKLDHSQTPWGRSNYNSCIRSFSNPKIRSFYVPPFSASSWPGRSILSAVRKNAIRYKTSKIFLSVFTIEWNHS